MLDTIIEILNDICGADEGEIQPDTELFEEGNRLKKTTIPNPEYYAKMIISGIADLASHTEADFNEIVRMIEELIGKAGK